jgi:hypothetical protein
MTQEVLDIIERAMGLSSQERARIAAELPAGLEGSDSPENLDLWRREAERRIQEIDEGRAQLLSRDEARRFITGIQ